MDTLGESKKLSSTQLRKIKKPLIEKRRRERINDSLSQLKSLILEALNKDENQYNKMEKADILELTVKHLKSVMRQQKGNLQRRPCVAMETNNSSTNNTQTNNSESHLQDYKAGFVHCVSEVQQYMEKTGHLQRDVKHHLSNHLNARLQDMPSSDQVHQAPQNKLNGYVHILPKEAMTLQSPQGMQCIQPLPVLNGQTLVLANPVQNLHSPTSTQPMLQLAQPLVTYIPQQQLVSSNANLNKMVPVELVQVQDSQNLVSSVKPNNPVTSVQNTRTESSSTIQKGFCNADVKDTSLSVKCRSQDQSEVQHGSFKVGQNERDQFEAPVIGLEGRKVQNNLNLRNETEVSRDFNCNKMNELHSIPNSHMTRTTGIDNINNRVRFSNDQLNRNYNNRLVAAESSEPMWRPW